MVGLVLLEKSMREISCDPFLEELGVEISKGWIQKVEKTLSHIRVSKNLWVDYVTYLLTNRAGNWCKIIQIRRVTKEIYLDDFKMNLEKWFYFWYNHKDKEKKLLDLKQEIMTMI